MTFLSSRFVSLDLSKFRLNVFFFLGDTKADTVQQLQSRSDRGDEDKEGLGMPNLEGCCCRVVGGKRVELRYG